VVLKDTVPNEELGQTVYKVHRRQFVKCHPPSVERVPPRYRFAILQNGDEKVHNHEMVIGSHPLNPAD
jgi:hypothetical protein